MGNENSTPAIDTEAIERLKGDFCKLNEPTKVQCLVDLVKTCGYREQLDFNERLQELLHKDFVSLLPDDLSKRVISFLSVDDAITCLRVSKNWKKVIEGCSAFWEPQAKRIGLSEQFIREKTSNSSGINSLTLPNLITNAVGHQTSIRSLTPRPFVITSSKASSEYNYTYAGNGVSLCYEEMNGHAQVIIESMDTAQSDVRIATFNVTSFTSRIKWAAASHNYVMWKQLDGHWHGCSVRGEPPELESWEDEPISQGFHSISFCPECHLVAIMSEAEDDCEVWDLQVVKLVRGRNSARKMVYPVPLERVQNVWMKKRHFLGGEVMMLPDVAAGKDKKGFCMAHRVLLQIDSNLAIHRLESVPDAERRMVVHRFLPDAKLSKPIAVFSPSPPSQDEMFASLDLTASKGRPLFRLSMDNKRIGLVSDSYFYVWNMSSLKQEKSVDLIDLNLPSDTKCVAVGSLYAVLASDSAGMCYVILIETGDILLKGSVADSDFNPNAQRSVRFDFRAPVSQDWLNGFRYYDHWPLAMVLDHGDPSQNDPSNSSLTGSVSSEGPGGFVPGSVSSYNEGGGTEEQLQALVGLRAKQKRKSMGLSLDWNTIL